MISKDQYLVVRSKIKCEIWTRYDFLINKYYWKNKGLENATYTRTENLRSVVDILTKSSITNWLMGNTLIGIFKNKQLLDDHDDDIGIFEDQKELFFNLVLPKLHDEGFQLIRINTKMCSVLRNERYIDICFFQEKNKKLGYSNKWFSKKLLTNFRKIEFKDFYVSIPENSKEFIKEMDFINFRNIIFYKYLNPRKYNSFLRKKIKALAKNSLSFSFVIAKCLYFIAGFRLKSISYQDFLGIIIEPENSFNWKWRKNHLDIVTDGGKFKKVSEIILYLSSTSIDESIIETNTSEPFYDPHNFDQRFWNSGNNYFAYCVKYGFRTNVVPYEFANRYIKEKKVPFLFTKEYFESLPVMNDAQILKLLRNHPIEIENNCVLSGKHRVFAMVGRILDNQSYLPFRVIEKVF